MALSGTLEELAVVDVIQFAAHAHLSGCLLLRRSAEEAELFYRKGGLVHARLGSTTGVEVLVQVVDWGKGEFEFRTGMDAPGETIRMDLHRAVMHALKTRDERKLEEERRKAVQVEAAKPPAPTAGEVLGDLIAPLDFVEHAALFHSGGLLASAHKKGAPAEDLGPLCQTMKALIESHPRGEVRRAILDDEKGTVILSQAPAGRWLVVVAVRGVTLGAVTVGMGRLISKLPSIPTQNGNRVSQ